MAKRLVMEFSSALKLYTVRQIVWQGSGKTFTMGTADMDQQDPELMGIIPRVTQEIFTTIQVHEL
jgi:hypothetical protein